MTSDSTNTSSIKIVYVEDDERLARLTSEYLRTHNIDVFHVSSGDAVIYEVTRVNPDVIVLDIMLPGMNGLEVCRKVRERSDLPIILVTARTEEADRVIGLEGGADDYLTKPFSARELVARIRAQSRRSRRQVGPRQQLLRVDNLTIDPTSMSVTLSGNDIVLTTQEFEILRIFAERPGRVLTREQLLELVHGTASEAFDRSIDVHISRLRTKLGDDSRHPKLLKTVRGLGYMLATESK